MKTLIKNGLLIDPANQVQAYLNLILEDGKVVAVQKKNLRLTGLLMPQEK